MRSLEFLILLYPGGLAMALRSTRARIFSGGKGSRCIELTALQPLYTDRLEIWRPHPPGALRAFSGL